jgi:type IV secretory pathway VirD2 relaxase
VDADRWTRLDLDIRFAANEMGHVDLRPMIQTGREDPELRPLMVGRLQKLERMGPATSAGSAQSLGGLEAERTLRDLGMRGDIIKTMQRAFTERGHDRGVSDCVIESAPSGSPISGRLLDTGLHDEFTGEAYAVIDGTDGRDHHVRFRGVEAFEHAPPPGGIV